MPVYRAYALLPAGSGMGIACLPKTGGFLFFYFFIFVFYKNIFLFSKFTEIYPGRPAARRQGLFCKNFANFFAKKPLEDQSPDSGAAGPPGRPAAGRPPPPLYKGLVAPHPLICLTKNPEKKKREGGRERRGEGEAKRRSSVGFLSRRLQVTKIFYILQIDYVVIIFVDTVD